MANLAKLKDSCKKWALRYLKYNVIGLTVFAFNIVLYVFLFNFLGEWAYILVSVNGGIIEFALISYFNRTKKGIIFDSCSPIDNK
jgi:inner membrane protein involved in colicin E2 resistance